MKLYHCKKCGTFIGPYGCDELCPTCRRKETYLTKEEVVAMLTEIQEEAEKEAVRWYVGRVDGKSDDIVLIDTLREIIQEKIDKLKEQTE